MKAILYWNGFSHQIFYPIATQLVKMGFEVYTVEHPYNKFDSKRRIYSRFFNFNDITTYKSVSNRIGFPYSYFFDLLWPFEYKRYFIAISFSPHLTLRNIILKKIGLLNLVVHWNIDYSPIRFQNRVLNFIYAKMDKLSLSRSDLQIDLSQSAQTERLMAYGLKATSKNAVIPVGTTFQSEPIFANDKTLNFVFLGKFNWNQDIDLLIRVFSDEEVDKLDVKLHLIGDGENFLDLKDNCISNKIVFYGNKNQFEIDGILRDCQIGLAPYVEDSKNFTSFADPSKIKKYSEFALPLIITSVPPNSKELADLGAALVGPCDFDFFKNSVIRLYQDSALRNSMSNKSKTYCIKNDWEKTLEPLNEFILNHLNLLNKN